MSSESEMPSANGQPPDHQALPEKTGRPALPPDIPRSRLRRFLRWLAIILCALGAIVTALFLARDFLIRSLAERHLRQQTDLETKISRCELKLASGTLKVNGLRIFNPPEFGGLALIEIPEIFIQLDARHSSARTLRLKLLRLNVAEMNVVRNKDGRLNLDCVERVAKAVIGSGRSGTKFGGIEQILLSVERASYRDLQDTSQSRVFQLGIKDELMENITSAEDASRWFSSLLLRTILREAFSGKNRHIELSIEGAPVNP